MSYYELLLERPLNLARDAAEPAWAIGYRLSGNPAPGRCPVRAQAGRTNQILVCAVTAIVLLQNFLGKRKKESGRLLKNLSTYVAQIEIRSQGIDFPSMRMLKLGVWRVLREFFSSLLTEEEILIPKRTK